MKTILACSKNEEIYENVRKDNGSLYIVQVYLDLCFTGHDYKHNALITGVHW